jgi:hypothetical protein
MHWPMHLASRCRAQIEAKREAVPIASSAGL